ncbi:unnamed protein product [Miscanthus lutarioriparius]|uniref:RING-type E3 ubiquitin transferase n=1 Tax=Miscanthus lutarioriparius TaxID=422564 RepID=A0A811MZJ2_9POAL|nr:unnamed protein product [Miscanthus lutarioriparius]
MLQIRLSKIGSSDSGAAATGSAAAAGASAAVGAAAALGGGIPESVTVACPDHLVIADLPVAKSLGAVTTSAAAATRAIGRRSRRPLGERVHICSRCEFPIAIYGRLIPCEHAFCLTCARSDSSCYLCDERIQKIQSVKMMEGIFICAAPMCLKSFLKKADFEFHVPDVHANLLQTNQEKEEERNESDAPNISRASAGDTQRQSQMPEMSTARAPPRSGVSQDREERSRYHQSREQTPLRPPTLSKPPSFHGRHSYPPGDTQAENNPPQGFDWPYNWASQLRQESPGAVTPLRQESDHSTQDKQQLMANAPYMFPPIPPHQGNFMMPMNMNQPLIPNAPFNYPLQQDGNPQYFSAPFPMQLPDTGPDQGSMPSVQPPAGPMSFPEGLQRPWAMGLMPFQSMALGQGMADGVGDPQGGGGLAFMQAGFGGMPDGSMNTGMPDRGDGRGILAQMPMPMQMHMSLPPPPPTQPPSGSQQTFNRS